MNRGKDWKKIQIKIIERDGKCLKCGNTENLHVHHVIPYSKTKDNSEENLVTLCIKCHKTEENKYRRYGITHYTIFP